MQTIRDIQKQLAAAEKGSRAWGFLQMQLGDVLQEMDESPKSQEAAIEAYGCALSVYHIEQAPQEWAQIAIRLATVYLYRSQGMRSQNLMYCIGLNQKALAVLSKQVYEEDWAFAVYNMGTAYLNMATGDRSANIERGIAILNELLSETGATELPEQWARVHNQLGIAFLYRISGERGQNLEMALGHFSSALKVFTIAAHRFEWAQASNNLATVYLERTQGERSGNLEEAIAIYKALPKVFTLGQFPVEWAKTHANLGETYRNRIAGDKSQNLEEAIDACRAALLIFTKEQFPLDWARNHIHIGNIYANRLVGDPAQNIENAIAAFQEAFTIYAENKAELPIEWGYAQIALGMAYRARKLGEPAANSEKAISAYQAALTLFTFENYPEEWARVQNNLGNAYADSKAGDPAININQAIAAFSAALTVVSREQYPVRWAMVQNNLGFAYLSRGHGYQNLLAAENAFKYALLVRTRDQLPVEFIRTSRLLGETYYHLGKREEARAQFRQALDAADDLRHLATNVVSHLQISQDMADTFRMAIHTALQLGYTNEAAMLTIASKGRTLAGRMNALSIANAQLTSPGPELTARMQQLQEVEKEIKWSEGNNREREQLQAKRKELVDRIAVDYPAMAPVRYFEPLTETEVWHLITASGNLPVLDYVQHTGGCGVFLYKDGAISYIELEETAFAAIEKVTVQIKQEKFWDSADQKKQLRNCYELVFAPVRFLLPEAGQLLISPSGSLNQLPFHALPDGEDDYLSSKYAMNFVPSLSILSGLRNHRPTGHLLNIAHPGQKGDPYFIPMRRLVVAEMEAVGACFSKVTTLFEAEAKPVDVIAHANAQPWDVIHINSHGSYTASDPTRSGLHLQGSEMLTIQDILLEVKLKGSPLVTLSACQTGQMQLRDAEEHTGLVSAFLISGASAVVSSLWKVPAGPTKLLMEQFYTLRRNTTQTDAQLLQGAMAKVRSLEPYKNPVCWAAFQVTGLPLI